VHGEEIMANDTIQASRDWLANTRTNALAWRIPQVAILGGLLVPELVRSAIWIIALIWMGAACILNARRCNRTHCRYTGPYYLAMIVPVLALGSGAVSVSFYAWLALACVILLGSRLVWWATELAWGRYS
jgi:Ca2+/Na+ antiporter